MEKEKGAARKWLFTVGLVAAWYSSNIGVLLLNKYLLSNYGFKYPIFLTMCHMSACSLLSYVAIAWMKVAPMQAVRSRVQFAKIAALSLVFCGSVVSGNISLRFLPVSFNQAIGATTPFFTAVFAYIMTLRREAWITYVTLIPVVTGVIIASGVSSIWLFCALHRSRNLPANRNACTKMLSPAVASDLRPDYFFGSLPHLCFDVSKYPNSPFVLLLFTGLFDVFDDLPVNPHGQIESSL